MSLGNRNGVPIRVFNHSHPTNGSGRRINNERHRFLLQRLHKRVMIGDLKRDQRSLGPRNMSDVGGGDRKD